MGHAARLKDVKPPVALPVELDVAQQQPGVHQRGNAEFRPLKNRAARGQADEESGNLPRLEQVDQTEKHRVDLNAFSDGNEVADRVDDNRVRLEVLDVLVNRRQVRLETEQR